MTNGTIESTSVLTFNLQKLQNMSSMQRAGKASKPFNQGEGIDKVSLSSFRDSSKTPTPGSNEAKPPTTLAQSRRVVAAGGTPPVQTPKQAALTAYKAMLAFGG